MPRVLATHTGLWPAVLRGGRTRPTRAVTLQLHARCVVAHTAISAGKAKVQSASGRISPRHATVRRSLPCLPSATRPQTRVDGSRRLTSLLPLPLSHSAGNGETGSEFYRAEKRAA